MEDKPSAFEAFELNISDHILGLLKETSTWTYFLSILGFIGIGLMLLFGVMFGTILSDMPTGSNPYEGLGFNPAYFGLIYVVLAIVYFFPVYYLFNFSRKMKSALLSKNNEEFVKAFSNLKSHYKFVGIVAIVVIGLYILAFLLAALGASLI